MNMEFSTHQGVLLRVEKPFSPRMCMFGVINELPQVQKPSPYQDSQPSLPKKFLMI